MNQHMATHPGATTKDFYAAGDRSPTTTTHEGQHVHVTPTGVDTTTPFCCEDLHDPPCMAYYGMVPTAIREWVVKEEDKAMGRKQAKKRKREEQRKEQQAAKKKRESE